MEIGRVELSLISGAWKLPAHTSVLCRPSVLLVGNVTMDVVDKKTALVRARCTTLHADNGEDSSYERPIPLRKAAINTTL